MKTRENIVDRMKELLFKIQIGKNLIKKLKTRKGDLGPSKAAAQRQVRTDEKSTPRMVTLILSRRTIK